jgi:hypothetical protein
MAPEHWQNDTDAQATEAHFPSRALKTPQPTANMLSGTVPFAAPQRSAPMTQALAFAAADEKALAAYRRARGDGAPHALALNIACSVWSTQCPDVRGIDLHQRFEALLTRSTVEA